MIESWSSRHWFFTCCWFITSACQDRPLDLLPGPSGAMSSGGATAASAGVSGSLLDAGGSGAGFQAGGAGSSNVGGSSDQSATAGAAGSVVSGGTSGTKSCISDADCAPPTPGCSPTEHVCKQCSKDSQCPNGIPCSVDDGECGS